MEKIKTKVIAVTRDIADVREDTKRIVDGIFENYLSDIATITSCSSNEMSFAERESVLEKLAKLTNGRIEQELHDGRSYVTEMDRLGGKAAGVCYSSDGYSKVLTYDDDHIERIIKQTKNGGHHSPYDHSNIVMSIDGIPKVLAMILNNEKPETTSEKSARYTKMHPSKTEEEEYYKWIELAKRRITDLVDDDPKKINKKALELARYCISCTTPTSMIYSVSYRQLNLEYQMLEKLLYDEELMKINPILKRIKPQMRELMDSLEQTGYINDSIKDTKDRRISLFVPDATLNEEYFGDVYSVNYQASIACGAQNHRHRTIDVEASVPKEYGYYSPNLFKTDINYQREWDQTMRKVADVYPQGMLLDFNEQGNYKNFIMKLKERRCMNAQSEIFDLSDDISRRMLNAYEAKNHRNTEDLSKRVGKLRCQYCDYCCPMPCGNIARFRGPAELVPEISKGSAYRLI